MNTDSTRQEKLTGRSQVGECVEINSESLKLNTLDLVLYYFRTELYYRRALGCARFAEILQNFTERQILWSLCSVDFLTFTLRLPIQTSLSLASKLWRKMSKFQENQSTPGEFIFVTQNHGIKIHNKTEETLNQKRTRHAHSTQIFHPNEG